MSGDAHDAYRATGRDDTIGGMVLVSGGTGQGKEVGEV